LKLPVNTIEVKSNIEYDETVRVGIADDDEAVALVIERLISTYKNPYRAALREYTSNAYDEHLEAGVNRPIEVNLPTALSPVLSIRDYGRGLTRDELKGYGTIGKSTKRDSNETTGGFGMGSKSALAAAPQFTVVSVKDGKRNTVVVARDENNIPHMNFLAEADTDDESGTTVIIPLTNPDLLGDLKSFWLGWKPGSILVDDEQPKVSVHDPAHFRPLKNGLGWEDLRGDTSGRDTIRAMINQVYYELEYKDFNLSYNQWNLLKKYIVRIENGTVDIHGSRETLLFNARTKATLQARVDAILMLSAREQMEAIKNAPDVRTAFSLRARMKQFGYPVHDVKWRGKRLLLPGERDAVGNVLPDPEGTWANPHPDATRTGWRVDKNWGSLGDKAFWNTYSLSAGLMIVHSAGEPTSYGKWGNRKAHRESFGVGEFLSTVADSATKNWDVFITSEPLHRINRYYRDAASVIVSADDFNTKVKTVRDALAKEARDGAKEARANSKLHVLTFYGRGESHEVKASEISNSYEYVVFLRNRDGFAGEIRSAITTKANFNRNWYASVKSLVNHYGVAVVLLNKSDKVDDLLDVLPPVTTIPELAVKRIEESTVTTTKYDLMALRDRDTFNSNILQYFGETELAQIKDKKLAKWINSMVNFRDTGAPIRENLSWLSPYVPEVAAAIRKAAGNDDKSNLPESPVTQYPLLPHLDTYSYRTAKSLTVGPVIEYVNLLHASRKKA
jgi:hypothetical protein